MDALSKCLRFKYSDINEDAAFEGTALHEAYETENLNGLDDEQRNAVTGCIQYAGTLMANDGGPDNWVRMKEVRLVLEDRTYGHADDVILHKILPIAHVIDAKFIRVEGDYDRQVTTYGAAVVEMCSKGYKFMNSKDELLYTTGPRDILLVTTHVVAPRIRNIQTSVWGAADLLARVYAEIDDLYARIDDPFLPPTPDEGLCAKCARAASCPALGQAVVAMAKGSGLPLPEAFAPDAIVSLRDRAIAQALVGAMSNWADQVKKNNNEFAKNGGEIPGFTLRSRSTGIRIDKEFTDSAISLLETNGFSRDTVMKNCSLTLGQLAKDQASNTGEAEADVKETLRAVLGDYVTEGQTQYLQKSKRIADAVLLAEIAGK